MVPLPQKIVPTGTVKAKEVHWPAVILANPGPHLSYIKSMCGRATYLLTWEQIVRLYRLTLDQPAQNTRARYNICPTATIDTIVERDAKRELVRMRWGLVPSWWSKPLKDLKLATFNLRP